MGAGRAVEVTRSSRGFLKRERVVAWAAVNAEQQHYRTLHEKRTCIGYVQCAILEVYSVRKLRSTRSGAKRPEPQEAFKPAALESEHWPGSRMKGEDSGAIRGPPLLCCLARDTAT